MIDIPKALWGSFFGKDFAYYPRESEETITSDKVIQRILPTLESVTLRRDAKPPIDRAKDSLEEAKKQTEYQDGKASRLLTIIAFLTAAIGTVFGKFVDVYPLHKSLALGGGAAFWVGLSYLLFGFYLLLVGSGAMVIFHAMRSRFAWPNERNDAERDRVRSFLFFQQIIRTRPEVWGSAFAGDSDVLLREYYKNYVTEAYLVATKAADKLRYLDPGQRLLLHGIRMLLAVFVAVILTFALVPPASSQDNNALHSPATLGPASVDGAVVAPGSRPPATAPANPTGSAPAT